MITLIAAMAISAVPCHHVLCNRDGIEAHFSTVQSSSSGCKVTAAPQKTGAIIAYYETRRSRYRYNWDFDEHFTTCTIDQVADAAKAYCVKSPQLCLREKP